MAAPGVRTDLISESELRVESDRFLAALGQAVGEDSADPDITDSRWAEVRELLTDLSRSRAGRGFTPTETATFVFSLKEPLFNQIRVKGGEDADLLVATLWSATRLIDNLGLFTAEAFLRSREEVIRRQQDELIELSTPVVKLWQGVVAVPLIGTLDSARTQVVMENLLERIVETDSAIAIIDITGVPTVDTLVAQHLLKTVTAARLMGADCIISGIRPQIAQTIVHLGLDLSEVVTKSSLADAVVIALERTGFEITRRRAKTLG
jgi:rsbT co-antagonist protein RsbR